MADRDCPGATPQAEHIEVRQAREGDVDSIRGVLSESFEPYRQYYTDAAYEATAISTDEITRRVHDETVEVLVVICGGEIAGTVSVSVEGTATLYIQSMALKPGFQGRGIGLLMLEEISHIAEHKGCRVLSLECYEPLVGARRLYERFGFKRTGKKRDYHGITVFEMVKGMAFPMRTSLR